MLWLIIVIYILWCVFLCLGQNRIVFPRHCAPDPTDHPYGDNALTVRIMADRNTLVEAWFLPAPSATPQNPAPLVVFFHGNAEIIDYQHRVVQSYHALGCSVLLPEYRGYGRSGGSPSQSRIRADAMRFYDEMLKRPDVDAKRIFFHGRSVGGGAAADLASVREPAALILESTFTNLTSFAIRYLAPPFLVTNPFHTDRVLKRTTVPVLLFHGREDTIIPVTHGRRLHIINPESVYIEYDCGHNDFPGPGNEDAYWKSIASFLSEARILRQPLPPA